MSANRLRGARGMSLLELLMALSVAGVASGIAFASFERNVSAAREAGAARAFAKRSSVPRASPCTSSRHRVRLRSAHISMATAMASERGRLPRASIRPLSPWRGWTTGLAACGLSGRRTSLLSVMTMMARRLEAARAIRAMRSGLAPRGCCRLRRWGVGRRERFICGGRRVSSR
jgi:prepilin-type N-terminal cleavage/methylation domain-containing protein